MRVYSEHIVGLMLANAALPAGVEGWTRLPSGAGLRVPVAARKGPEKAPTDTVREFCK